MNIKIQGGGGGVYANTGSCAGVVNYLQHEDKELMRQSGGVEPFFNHEGAVSPQKVKYQIDNNKAKLCKKDSKFFVITVSPSKEEIKKMGNSMAERSNMFKGYVLSGVMEQYARGFDKGLTARDLKFYAKIHHTRGDKEGEQMHAHIIVSRKDATNKIKLSPMTNHRNTKKGQVKGGFDRSQFIERCETVFDLGLGYKRDFEQSYKCNLIKKKGTPEQLLNLKKEELKYYQHKENLIVMNKEREREQSRDRGMSR